MPKVWLLAAISLILAGIVTAAIVTLLAGDDRLLSASSPAGVVQRYIRALRDEDYRNAYSYLSAKITDNCSYERYVKWRSFPYPSTDVQVTLERTHIRDGVAQVTVRVTEMVQAFPPMENSYDLTYHLEQEDGQWRLVVLPGPWSCPPVR